MDYYSGAGHYDRETVRFFDVAHEGAQLRAISQHMGSLEHLRGTNPRSVVIVATDQIAAAAAQAALTLRTPLDVPVVVTGALPTYVGALDVVLMVGDHAGREEDARALITAANRGAVTVLAGPARGPLLDDAPAATVILPALPTAAGPSPARTMAAVGAVLDAVTCDPEEIAQQLAVLAEEVDQELTSLSPERDISVNPARQLRLFAADARVVHAGAGRCGGAVAKLVSELWSARGLPSGYADVEELAASREFAAPGADDMFELVPLKTVLWAHSDTAGAPNTRAEAVDAAELGEQAQAARLVTRAFAATALEDSVEGV